MTLFQLLEDAAGSKTELEDTGQDVDTWAPDVLLGAPVTFETDGPEELTVDTVVTTEEAIVLVLRAVRMAFVVFSVLTSTELTLEAGVLDVAVEPTARTDNWRINCVSQRLVATSFSNKLLNVPSTSCCGKHVRRASRARESSERRK